MTTLRTRWRPTTSVKGDPVTLLEHYPPGRCSGCDTVLCWQPARGEDRYVWADLQGNTQVPTGKPHPLAVASEIGRRMRLATTGPKRSRGVMPSDEEMNYYSVIIGCPWAYGSPHIHKHDAQPMHGHSQAPDDLPWHCGEPMHLRPSGWHCRARCGATQAA